ncbi:MAG: Coenzyme F420 hydrogenase/dehydrogenase, beta subunit C-terminal domain [Bacteroidales bacterium]|nr:Coenzyme F420 hydrogenase/dehydrogenase, beta subunit C-terminal domain [Bacteroidales bacterium]
MKPDEEGFLFPVIDNDQCIDCGTCYKQCPCNSVKPEPVEPIYYASAIKDKESLLESSSGGTFIALAQWMLYQGGYVCGCVMNEYMKAVHICTNDIELVRKMQGSKYVQSTITECLNEANTKTSKGNLVLFTGTACQIAAAKKYIKNTDKLYLVDILCHGVPSPLYLKKYVSFLEEKHKGKLTKLEFRNKKQLGWGSEHRTYYEIEKNGKVKGFRPSLPAYFCSFFWGINLRISCYNCMFACENRISDITIGDFWGYWTYFHKKFPEGISINSVNTEKGKYMIEKINNQLEYCIPVSKDQAKGTNTNFFHPTKIPATRKNFYKGIEKMKYRDFIWRVYLDKSSRMKMLTSLYGRYMPKFIKGFRTNHKKDVE